MRYAKTNNLLTCTNCGRKFRSYRDFSDHRIGDYDMTRENVARLCLGPAELVERGFRFIDGTWSQDYGPCDG